MHKVKSLNSFDMAKIILLGYLAYFFFSILPYANELLVLDNGLLFFPNILKLAGSKIVLQIIICIFGVTALVGIFYRNSKFIFTVIFYALLCFFHMNYMSYNPGQPFLISLVGFLAFSPSLGKIETNFLRHSYLLYSLLLYLGYFYSGLDKLLYSDLWRSGEALEIILKGIYSRSSLFNQIFFNLPDSLQSILTQSVVALELVGIMAIIFWKKRHIVLGILTLLQLGILVSLSFTELSLLMLMIHFLLWRASFIDSEVNS